MNNNIIKELYTTLCDVYKRKYISQYGQIIYINNDNHIIRTGCFSPANDHRYSNVSERRSIFIDQYGGELIWINSWGYE